jgi:hypothetical protein
VQVESALLIAIEVLESRTHRVTADAKGLRLPRTHPAVGPTNPSVPLAGGEDGQQDEHMASFDIHVHVTPCDGKSDASALPLAVAHLLTILVTNKV